MYLFREMEICYNIVYTMTGISIIVADFTIVLSKDPLIKESFWEMANHEKCFAVSSERLETKFVAK